MEKKAGPDSTTCSFYMAKKVRYCKFPRIPGSIYCCHHAGLGNTEDYVKCPSDPRHFVKKVDLEAHVKVCPKTKQMAAVKSAVWYKEDVNTKNPTEPHESASLKSKLKELAPAALKELCDRIKVWYGKAKALAESSKILMPEEDFWSYLPGPSQTSTHSSGGEKQKTQHIMLCV